MSEDIKVKRLRKVKKEDQTEEQAGSEVQQENIEVSGGVDDIDLDAPIFPGGPSMRWVNETKARLTKEGLPSDLVVLAVSGEDMPFIYRKLSRKDYLELQAVLREAQDESYRDDIMDRVVLWPENWTREKRNAPDALAGTPRTVFEHIMDTSGFNVIGSFVL